MQFTNLYERRERGIGPRDQRFRGQTFARFRNRDNVGDVLGIGTQILEHVGGDIGLDGVERGVRVSSPVQSIAKKWDIVLKGITTRWLACARPRKTTEVVKVHRVPEIGAVSNYVPIVEALRRVTEFWRLPRNGNEISAVAGHGQRVRRRCDAGYAVFTDI